MTRGIKKAPIVVQPDLSPAGNWELTTRGKRGAIDQFHAKAEAVDVAREEMKLSKYPAMVVRDGNGETQYITLNSDVLKTERFWERVEGL